MKNDLIYDIGMHDAQDAAFYMHKGYRVIAVEANPVLCERAQQTFSKEIKDGRLKILNAAISDAEGELAFYVNLDDDHWSSLDPVWGTRNGTRFETIKVHSIRFDSLIREYGVPYYLKIDIEGGDLTVLQQLKNSTEKPQHISVEEHALEYFPLLWSLGYRGFKTVNQSAVPHLDYDGWKFKPGTSGPFGDEAPGQWLPFGDAILDYMLNIRDCRDRELFSTGWYDIHATLNLPRLAPDHPYPKSRKSTLRSRTRAALGRVIRRLQWPL